MPKFEIDTQPIINNALTSDKIIYYPVVINKEDMIMKNDTMEYKDGDLILVPGLLYGLNNKGRIGYGRGYYDRKLS